jgi:hypothetical protein
LIAGACFAGHGHTFFELGQCQPANRVVVLQLRLDSVALDV